MRRILRTCFGYLAAAYLTLVIVLVGYGVAAPRLGDRDVLADAGANGMAILVGLQTVARQAADGLHVESTRYYATWPESLRQGRVWAVSRTDDASPAVSASRGAFWTIALLFLASLFGTVSLWLRPPRAASVAPNAIDQIA